MINDVILCKMVKTNGFFFYVKVDLTLFLNKYVLWKICQFPLIAVNDCDDVIVSVGGQVLEQLHGREAVVKKHWLSKCLTW